MKITSNQFLRACSLSIALIGSTAVVAVFSVPDFAYAKNGNGGGKGGGNGNSGGNGASKSDGAGAKAAGKGGKKSSTAKGSRKSSSKAHRSKGNAGAKSKKSAGKGASLREIFGGGKKKHSSGKSAKQTKAFQRKVKSVFGGETKRSTRPSKSARIQKTTLVETSPRPVTRLDVAKKSSDIRKKQSKRYRDPLVAAITDPYGSDKLKNLNASNAAAQAFRNASPNSNVGKIATYQEAAEDYYALRDDLTDARRELKAFNESYDGRTSEEIAEDIAALDPNDPDYDADRDALAEELKEASDFEDAQMELADDVRDIRGDTRAALESAESAFFDASKGRTLTRDALGDFHENIGLPEPSRPRKDRPEVSPYDFEATPLPGETLVEVEDYADAVDQKDRRSKRYRDPLVAAITDPYGSDKLKNLNASNAAAQAFRNASPNSNVGKIATYQEAAEDYYALRDDLTDARRELKAFNESYDGRTSEEIAEDIAALDPNDPDYDADRDALAEELKEASDFEDERMELADDVRDVRRETLFASKDAEQAFYQASKGSSLTPQALSEFHSNLGLPTLARK